MNNTVWHIREITKKVDGWLSDQEGETLYNLARRASAEGVIVEIGSWKGKSTIWLAKGSEEGPRIPIYAVDPHVGSQEHQGTGPIYTFEEFKKNIAAANVEHLVIPIVTPSAQAAAGWDKKISLLWIDGSHEYEDVLQDYMLWSPFLLENAFIALHDTVSWPGPRIVAQEHLLRSQNFAKARIVDNITLAAKKKAGVRHQLYKQLLIAKVQIYLRYRYIRRQCINLLVLLKKIIKHFF